MSASSSVVREGNSYSGSNIAGDVTFRNPDGSVRSSGGSVSTLPAGASPMGPAAGFAPGGISTQNMGAADALAAREYAASMGRLMASGQIAPPAAGPSLSLPGGSFGFRRDRNIVADERGAQARFAYGQGTDPASRARNAQLQQTAMQEAGYLARTGIQEQGANAREAGRNALAQGELGLKREAAGFQTRAAQQQEQLRNVLLDPKSTPEQRAVAQRNLAALSGKTAADRMQAVALPDTTNEMGQVVRGGQALVRVLEDGTVQQVPIGAQQGAALPPGMKRQIGTSNGRPVYEDMNGKQVIAKG